MNGLTLIDSKNLNVWEDMKNIEQIKHIFAPKLNPMEFTIFVEMGKATRLNPFLKEIWAIKYDERNPAQIFIGRDGYRKSAQRHPLYDFHNVDAVYSNDEFNVSNGTVHHKYCLKERGSLVGAYCIVHQKKSSHPTYVFVELQEYNKGQSVWRDKPATMIKKVAEAQALKMAFQELFAGSYHEYEEFEIDNNNVKKVKGVQGLKEKLGIIPIKEEVNEAMTIEIEDEITEEAIQKKSREYEIENIKWQIQESTTIENLKEIAKRTEDMSEEDKGTIRMLFKEKEKELKERK